MARMTLASWGAWLIGLSAACSAWAQAPPALTGSGDNANTGLTGNPSKLLREPPAAPLADFVPVPEAQEPVTTLVEPPLGFTGPSGVTPTVETDGNWVPVEDRWRMGFPSWDRYGKNHLPVVDYPNDLGDVFDPYHQNLLKGDYPIIGQHTFLNITATAHFEFDPQQTPIGTTPFESTSRPHSEEFFGSPNLMAQDHFLRVSFDLFNGDGGYKPADWRLFLAPVFDYNQLNADELGVVSTDVRKGTQRERTYASLEDYFVEVKLADLSPNYDFISTRIGSQFFSSDFRGFLYQDTNRAARFFGTLFENRDQFNLVFFRPAEKDTNSGLNTMDDRGQDVLIANYYHQDFIFPGYTVEGSVLYDHDPASFKFDSNGFLVRPDPVGVFQPHTIDVAYLGLGGDGHIGRINITDQFYWAVGHDTLNPLANHAVDINAYMAALELSYDRDWMRFRTSFFFASGDHNIDNGHATGFDTVMDNPNFAGGEFSYWQQEAIKLFGVNLKQINSLVPDLRSSKIQGQVNFVNPGLVLYNVGVDFDLTPKIKWINNVNWLWFDSTQVLQQYTFDAAQDTYIGTDISTGVEYRPLLSNNIIVSVGVATLIPGSGFKGLYAAESTGSTNALVAGFLKLNITY